MKSSAARLALATSCSLGVLLLPTAGAGGSVALPADGAGPSQSEPRYRLTQPAALLFDDFDHYILLFNLNRDVPRAPNRRAKAGIFLEGSMSPALFGGGKRQRCFQGSFSRDNRTGPPRFGRLYRFRLEVGELPDGPHEPGQLGRIVLRGQARLRRATPGYSMRFGNNAADPKAAALGCIAKRTSSKARSNKPSFTG